MTINEFLTKLYNNGYKITTMNCFGGYSYNVYFDNKRIAEIKEEGLGSINLFPFIGKEHIGESTLTKAKINEYGYDLEKMQKLLKYDEYDGEIVTQSLVLTEKILENALEYIYYCVEIYEKSRGKTKTSKFLNKIKNCK